MEYVIFNPNYDQNPGSNHSLTWHYIQDDSLIAVPWRQNFNDAADLGAWTALNPENNYTSWQLGAFSSEADNQVLALEAIEEGNSHWFASPLFDLSGTGQASVFFDWAASGFRSSDVSSFSMLVSSDGGYSYEEVWRKDNEEINTAGSTAITAEDFERQHINLSAFTGEAYEKVRVAFKAEHLQGRSNPIYLDNIELFLSADPNPVDPGLGQTIIYPNPAFDLFNIVFNLEDYEDVNIQITASTGQVVHDVDYPNTLNQTYTFSTSLFARGVFIVRITGEGVSSTKRLIIQ